MESSFPRQASPSRMITEEEATLASVVILIVGSCWLSQQRRRRWWVRPHIAERDSCGSAVRSLLHSLQHHRDGDKEDHMRFFLPMDHTAFSILLERVTPRIKRKDTCYRKAIPPGDRLALTLGFLVTGKAIPPGDRPALTLGFLVTGKAIPPGDRPALTLGFLVTGDTFYSLEKLYRFPKSTISHMVSDTCDAIYHVLRSEFLKVRQTHEDWLKISKQFEDTCHFPHCLGAVVGKEVIVQEVIYPPHADSRDQSCPVTLLALVDADCKFTYLDVRWHAAPSPASFPRGRAAFFTESSLSDQMENNQFNLPPDSALPHRRKPVPFVLAGDETFPLKPYLMKPYPGNQLSPENAVFNYRLSVARQCADKTMDILTKRFKVFSRPLFQRPENVIKIILACCALHNFLMSDSTFRQVYAPEEEQEEEEKDKEKEEEEKEKEEEEEGKEEEREKEEEEVAPDNRRKESGEVCSWGPQSVGNCWSLLPDHPAQGTVRAQGVREELCQYFSTDGAVPWQGDKIRR